MSIKKENKTTATFSLNDRTLTFLQYNRYTNGIAMGKTIELAVEDYIRKNCPDFDHTKYLVKEGEE